jgi:hypothetical protein
VDEIGEEGHETSGEDDQESDDNYIMQFRNGKGPAHDDDNDDDDEEEDYGGRERGEEEEEAEGQEQLLLQIRRPVNPDTHRMVNYLGMGKTKVARRKRREWPYGEPKDMASGIDYRFHIFF